MRRVSERLPVVLDARFWSGTGGNGCFKSTTSSAAGATCRLKSAASSAVCPTGQSVSPSKFGHARLQFRRAGHLTGPRLLLSF